jgi:hypothetical protein
LPVTKIVRQARNMDQPVILDRKITGPAAWTRADIAEGAYLLARRPDSFALSAGRMLMDEVRGIRINGPRFALLRGLPLCKRISARCERGDCLIHLAMDIDD